MLGYRNMSKATCNHTYFNENKFSFGDVYTKAIFLQQEAPTGGGAL